MPTYCARHPKVETALSCGRCETPICPDCSVSGAVGFLCQKCAFGDGNPLHKVKPERWLLGIVFGLLTGSAVGFLLQVLTGMIFLTLIVCPLIGAFMGNVILKAVGQKRGWLVEILAGASVVAGALISSLLTGMFLLFLVDPISLVFFLLAVVLTAGAAVARIRYL